MKKNLIIAALLVVNLITGFFLLYTSWRGWMWKSEAIINSKFAGGLLAKSHFGKGKIIKLRVVIEHEAKGYVPEPVEFEGPYVIRKWIGYTDPFFGGTDSPSIQVARSMVEAFNAEMREMTEHPEQYEQERDREIEYWQTNVLNKRDDSEKPDAVDGK